MKLFSTESPNGRAPRMAPLGAGARCPQWALGLTLALTLGGALGLAPAAPASPVTTTPVQSAPLDLAPLHPLGPLDDQGDGPDGAYPVASLTVGAYGTLYGVTAGGGPHGAGTVFKVNPDGTGYSILHAFDPDADGASPVGAVTFYGSNVLYGTTSDRGPGGGGTVWTMHTDGTGYTVLHSFSSDAYAGGAPAAALTSGGDGFFYGTTSGGASGGGMVYRIAPDGAGFTVLHLFYGGDTPLGPVLASGGVLYGTTAQGGSDGAGSVFKIGTSGSGYALLYSFTGGADGGCPWAGLTAGGGGFLYGTTSDAQLSSNGTVFRVRPDGTGFLTLYAFTGGADGCEPLAPVAVGQDGRLYGTAAYGGASGAGTVFALGADGTGFTTIASLSGADGDGGYPEAGLTPGGQGKWYGTSYQGGANDTGALFVLKPAPVTAHTHLLWNNADSRVMLWNVDAGGSVQSVTGYGPYTDNFVNNSPGNLWHATALAAAPDGTSRIVWNNADHRVMLWNVDGQGNVLGIQGYGPYTDTSVSNSPGNLWSAVGVSVGPDGVTHLLWSNVDHRMMFWDVDAAGRLLGLTGYGPYTDTSVSSDPGNLWNATSLATGPDGVSRVVWNNADHRVMLWSLSGPGGSAVTGIGGYGPYTDGAPQNKWSAQGVSVGPDNLTHLLWSNVDHRMMFWDVDAAGSVPGLTGYGPYTDTFVNSSPSNLWSAVSVATGPDGVSHVGWDNADYRIMLWGLGGLGGSAVTGIGGYGPYTDTSVSADPGNLWSLTAVSAGP